MTVGLLSTVLGGVIAVGGFIFARIDIVCVSIANRGDNQVLRAQSNEAAASMPKPRHRLHGALGRLHGRGGVPADYGVVRSDADAPRRLEVPRTDNGL